MRRRTGQNALPVSPGAELEPIEVWGRRGCPSFEIAGESHHLPEIAASLAGVDTAYGAQIDTVVRLVHEPANPFDSDAVAVVAHSGVLGYLPRELAPAYAAMLAPLQRAGRCAVVPATVWYADHDYHHGYLGDEDGDEDPPGGSVRLDLPEAHLLFPRNGLPQARHAELPDGYAIQVIDEEKHLPALFPYLCAEGACWVYATLHEIVEQGPRSSKTLAEIRIDGRVVGRLTPKMSSDLLPAVHFFASVVERLSYARWSRATV